MARHDEAKLDMSAPESWLAQDYSITLETTKSIRTQYGGIEGEE